MKSVNVYFVVCQHFNDLPGLKRFSQRQGSDEDWAEMLRRKALLQKVTIEVKGENMAKHYFNKRFWTLSIPIIVLVLVVLLVAIFGQSTPAATVTISGQYDNVWITPTTHAYCVQNDVWNPDSGWVQTLQVNNQTGVFTVIAANHAKSTSGPPASYASIYKGNHYGTATANSGLPKQVSGLSVSTSWSFGTVSTGVWDIVYDIWFHQTSDYSGGSPNGAELMVWLNYQGTIQPAGSKVATVSLAGATWEVWHATMNWQYIAYRRTSKTTSANFNINTFVTDAVSRGYIQNSWYLISLEAGFELWQGGTGLKSNSFSVSVE